MAAGHEMYITQKQRNVSLKARVLRKLEMFSSSPTMSSRCKWAQTVHSEESVDNDEPVEENWSKEKGNKRKRKRKGQSMNVTAGPSVIPIQNVEPAVPKAYTSDPMEQEIIDNIQNLLEIWPGGKVRSQTKNKKCSG